MKHEEPFWIASDGQRLQAYQWAPEAAPRAVVCLVHGLGEHAGRYAHVAQVFADAGFATLAFDLRGHGRTPGPRGHAPSFDVVMDDIGLLVERPAQGFPGAPRFLYGHSLGGSLVLNYALRRQPQIAGVIATSPGLRPARPISWTTRAAARLARRVWPSLSLPNGLDLPGISRDPDVVSRYLADPLVHGRVSARFGLESIEAGEWALAHAGEFRLPLLLVHGTADRLTSVEASREFASRVPAGCTLREWPGLYHETHNEPEWRAVLAETIAWMQQLPRSHGVPRGRE